MPENLVIRRFVAEGSSRDAQDGLGPSDASATRSIFQRAVRITAAAHYSAEQRAAWAPDPSDEEPAAAAASWADRRATANTWVAEFDGVVVGFTDLDRASGYVDMLFVDPDAGRRGIGSALLERNIDEARDLGLTELTVQVSLTARAVFERHGFVVVSEQTVIRHGIALRNTRMCLPLLKGE